MDKIPSYIWTDITHSAIRAELGLPRFVVLPLGQYEPQRREDVLFGSDHVQDAQAKIKELNQAAFDQHLRGKQLTRYITRWYVAIDPDDANRSCGIDHTPPAEMRVTENVEILHTGSGFTFWSDGKITNPVYHLPAGGCLSEDAVSLIKDVRGADGGSVEGGITLLARVAKILGRSQVQAGAYRGMYAPEEIEALAVEWTDGSTGTLYVHSAGYFEGYQYDVYQSLESLRRAYQPAPTEEGISVFPPDDFHYDSELGFVGEDE